MAAPTPGGGKAYTKGWVSLCCPGGLAQLLPIAPAGPKQRRHRRAGATMIVTVLCAVSRTSLHYSGPGSRWAFGPALALSGLGLDLRGPSNSSGSSPAWVFPSGLPGPPRPRSALSSRLAGPVRVRPSVGPRPPVRGPRPPVRRSVAAVPSVRSVWARCRGSLVLVGRTPGVCP